MPFLRQMFGPGVGAAIEAYRKAPEDRVLSAILTLIGSTPVSLHRFKLIGDKVAGYGEDGREILRVPVTEPLWVRAPVDPKSGVPRLNVN